jgi:hypothetical protein
MAFHRDERYPSILGMHDPSAGFLACVLASAINGDTRFEEFPSIMSLLRLLWRRISVMSVPFSYKDALLETVAALGPICWTKRVLYTQPNKPSMRELLRQTTILFDVTVGTAVGPLLHRFIMCCAKKKKGLTFKNTPQRWTNMKIDAGTRC